MTSEEMLQAEMKRADAVNRAVGMADRIILDASDGSVEETNYLTAMVAERFVQKVTGSTSSALLRKDLLARAGTER